MPDIIVIPPGGNVSLSPTASAFAHGFGFFETMRYADGQLYFWQDHWARLTKSARYFALELPRENAVLAALRELVAATNPREATLKLSLVKETEGSCLYLYARPPMAAPEGRRLRLDTSCPIAPGSILAGHKTHNYMEVMHLLSLARARGDYDTLRVDTDGNLAETCTANLFFIKDGRLRTPSLDTGILPGVTRAALLRAPGLAVEEGIYAPEVLLEAEAVFVTNATGGIQVIERIEGFSSQKVVDFSGDCPALAEIRAHFARLEAGSATELQGAFS